MVKNVNVSLCVYFVHCFLWFQGYVVPKRNRILCSGPLVPIGGNMEDMLKEHERQMQEAVRKSRLDKNRSRLN